MLLLVDNYDSFTYNLYQYLCELGSKITVVRNDKMTIKEMEKLAPKRIVISPGPGYPRDAGMSSEVIRHFADSVPILGVCLGHQCIAEAYGGVIDHAGEIKHGKSSLIHHDGKGVLADSPIHFQLSGIILYPSGMRQYRNALKLAPKRIIISSWA